MPSDNESKAQLENEQQHQPQHQQQPKVDSKNAIDVTLERQPGVGFGFSIYGGQVMPGSPVMLPVRVCKLKPNTPASQCGKIKIDHRIISINGVDVSAAPHARVVSLLKAAPDRLHLTLQDDIKEQELILRQHQLRSVTQSQRRPSALNATSMTQGAQDDEGQQGDDATTAPAVPPEQQQNESGARAAPSAQDQAGQAGQTSQGEGDGQKQVSVLTPGKQAYVPGKQNVGTDVSSEAVCAVDETVRVMYNYNGADASELTLLVGDFVHVSVRRDDGWCLGRCHRTGQQGLFPGNFAAKVRLKPQRANDDIYETIDTVQADSSENIYEELSGGNSAARQSSNRESRPYTPPSTDYGVVPMATHSAPRSAGNGDDEEEDIYQPMRDQVVRQTDHAIELANGDIYAVVSKPKAAGAGSGSGSGGGGGGDYGEAVYSTAHADVPMYVYDNDDDSMLYAKLDDVDNKDAGPPPIPDRK